MKHLVDVKNLKIHFPIKKGLLSKVVGHVFAVDGVSFYLETGETLGVVGESGCGKTTTALGAFRLIPITSGSIHYNGEDITRADKARLGKLRREIQVVFQDPYSSLNPRMTVNGILADPMEIHNVYPGAERQERIDYLLEKVGLSPDYARRYPHEFSGGQRQRIGIARALALNPKLIIGDEPVSALDVSIQAQIINLLMDLQQEFGLSYIIVAHDLAVVEHICDRIMVMYLGKVVETATHDKLYSDPKHPYAEALLSAIPVADPRHDKKRIILEGDVPSPIHPPSGCRFHPRCPKRMDICSKEQPHLKDLGDGHQVSCFLYQ